MRTIEEILGTKVDIAALVRNRTCVVICLCRGELVACVYPDETGARRLTSRRFASLAGESDKILLVSNDGVVEPPPSAFIELYRIANIRASVVIATKDARDRFSLAFGTLTEDAASASLDFIEGEPQDGELALCASLFGLLQFFRTRR